MDRRCFIDIAFQIGIGMKWLILLQLCINDINLLGEYKVLKKDTDLLEAMKKIAGQNRNLKLEDTWPEASDIWDGQ